MDIFFSSKNYLQDQLGWNYDDFVRGEIRVKNYDNPIKVKLNQLKTNDRASWQSATSDGQKVDCRIYEVTVNQDEDFDSVIPKHRDILRNAELKQNEAPRWGASFCLDAAGADR